MKQIYLDYNGTTPVDNEVAEAMQPYLTEHFGNPSSTHSYGVQSNLAYSKARSQVAKMLGAAFEEIICTSGGSEANNLAIKGIAEACPENGKHIITTKIEHPAVTEVCHYLAGEGYEITWLSVDEFGLISLEELKASIRPDTLLVSVMLANNEVGTIQPIRKIAEITKNAGCFLHTDAAQAVGKIPVDVNELGIDLLSIAGHKMYAPKSIGALYVRNGVQLRPQIHGAGQEMGLRAGTENVLLAVGLGKASELIAHNLEEYSRTMEARRDQLEAGVLSSGLDIRLNGHPEHRLPNTSSISFKSKIAHELLDKWAGIAASAGAACHSDQVNISTVLQAMHVPEEYALGTIRFSVGRTTTETEIVSTLQEILK